MREIKFRVWHKSNKNMEYFTIKDRNYYAFNDDGTADEFYEVMQYTNLKDKNGKEIYEGDILKDKYRTPGEVQWHDTLGAWFWDGGFEWGMIENPLEVIGNIYENPGLIPSCEDEDSQGKS